MVKLNFDPSTVEDDNDFEPLAPGSYEGELTNANLAQTKDAMSDQLVLQWKLENGRVVFDRLILSSRNNTPGMQTALQIAKSRLKKLTTLAGLAFLEDSDQLVGMAAVLKIGIQKNNPAYNEIQGYSAAEDQPVRRVAPPPVAAPIVRKPAPQINNKAAAFAKNRVAAQLNGDEIPY
jgi:hypothetical protein